MSKDMVSPEIAALLDQLTLEEQVALMAGADFWHTVPVERLNIPAVKVTDGPNGARGAGGFSNGTPAAAYPCAICLGASWNPQSAHQMGAALAQETRSKGARVLLAPTVNIHRSGLNGRNFECYSEDPMLTSALAVAFIRGLQEQGVAATIKHFVANDSEIERQTISSDVDERSLREIYLPPFEAAVKQAGVWAVMTGYNRLNGVHMDAQSWALRDVMRGAFGFDGVFVSDWFGTNSTVDSVNAGHDLEMPGPSRFRGAALLAAVAEGTVSPETIRAACGRILTLFARIGALGGAAPEPETTLDTPEQRALIRTLGAQGAVLLQNDGILPLIGQPSIAAIGPNAAVARIMGGGSAQINAPHRISPLDGLRAAFGETRVRFAQGCSNNRLTQVFTGDLHLSFFKGRDWSGTPIHRSREQEANFFWFDLPIAGFDQNDFSVRVEAEFIPEQSGRFRAGLTTAGTARVYLDDVEVIDGVTGWQKGMNFFGLANDERQVEIALVAGRPTRLRIDYAAHDYADAGITVRALRFGIEKIIGQAEIDEAVALARQQEVAVLCVGRQEEWDSEGHDLPHMRLPADQERLIEAVALANPNTVVALQTGGPIEMPWRGKVRAVVQFWYPGQEVGHVIADVLSGRSSPDGRLPLSFPAAMKDSSAWVDAPRSYPGQDGHVRYAEGVFVGYRHFDRPDAPTAAFPFGFGLSYTQFHWGQAQLSDTEMSAQTELRLALDVTNTGARRGVELVQLYVAPRVASDVARPIKELRDFARVALEAGETGRADLRITPRDLAYYDVARGGWVAPAGRYDLVLARDAAQEMQRLSLSLREDWFSPA